MATKRLLVDLSNAAQRTLSRTVQFESAGGVEVARSVRAGAQADLLVLDADVMSTMSSEGLLHADTLRPLFVSDVVAATPEDATSLSLSTEEDLRAALVRAQRVAYSTGPSGKAVVDLIERWHLGNVVRRKMVQARPGTPVRALLAGGHADLGFQQRSEFSDVTGIRVLGPLPGAAAITSTFSGAVLVRSAKEEAARQVLEFLGSTDADAHVLAAGMAPA